MSIEEPEEHEGFYYVRIRRTYINEFVMECYAKNKDEALRDAESAAESERVACWQAIGTQQIRISVKLDEESTALQEKQT